VYGPEVTATSLGRASRPRPLVIPAEAGIQRLLLWLEKPTFSGLQMSTLLWAKPIAAVDLEASETLLETLETRQALDSRFRGNDEPKKKAKE
jgi:hypothetical protein